MKIRCISEGFFDSALKTLGMAALSGATKGLYNYSMAADFKLPPEYFAAVYFHTSKLYTAEMVNNEIKQSMQQIFSNPSDPSNSDKVFAELAKKILPGNIDYDSLIKLAKEAAVPQPPAQATAATGTQTTTGAPTTAAPEATTQNLANPVNPTAATVQSPPSPAAATPAIQQFTKTGRQTRSTRLYNQINITVLSIIRSAENPKPLIEKKGDLFRYIAFIFSRLDRGNTIGDPIYSGNLHPEKAKEAEERVYSWLKNKTGEDYKQKALFYSDILHYLNEYIRLAALKKTPKTESIQNDRTVISELFNKITKDAEYQKYKSKREISTQQQNIQAASILRKTVTNMLIIYLNRTDTLLGGKLKEYTQTLNRYLESDKYKMRDDEAKKDAEDALEELGNYNKEKQTTSNQQSTTAPAADTTLPEQSPAESKNPFNKNFIFEAQYDD